MKIIEVQMLIEVEDDFDIEKDLFDHAINEAGEIVEDGFLVEGVLGKMIESILPSEGEWDDRVHGMQFTLDGGEGTFSGISVGSMMSEFEDEG